MEGMSLMPILGGKERAPYNVLCWEYHGNRAIRHGPWKLVSFPNQPWELYNMVNDRTELYNLAANRPDVVTELDHLPILKHGQTPAKVGVGLVTAKMLNDESE